MTHPISPSYSSAGTGVVSLSLSWLLSRQLGFRLQTAWHGWRGCKGSFLPSFFLATASAEYDELIVGPSDGFESRFSEDNVERPPIDSFARSGGINSKTEIDVFGTPMQYAVFWTPLKPVKKAVEDVAKEAFPCLLRKATTAESSFTQRYIDAAKELTRNPKFIASCLFDPISLTPPAAVLILLKQYDYSMNSDGEVNVYNIPAEVLSSLAKASYGGPYRQVSAKNILNLQWPSIELVIMF